MDCITDNELVELLEDRLPSARRATLLAELEHCADCRALAQHWAAASQPATAAPPDAPPAVGGYRLGDVIGAGAMGLVFRAHDDTLDRDVAIKIVRADDDAARARALAEGRMLATVRHPNVISVHAAGTGDGIAYLAMELATGTSLDRVLADRGPLAPAVAVRWFRGVAAGLGAAHDAGVIHRDIKPANLLLDRDQLRIADFGLASTRGGAPAGTLAYLAPEVGDGAAATPASDQFAFCVTLFEALAGRRPFVAIDLPGLRAAWRAGAGSWRGVPAQLRGVLARGLAHDPAARWPSMAAVEEALEAALRPRRWPVLAGAGVALAGAVAWLALHDSRVACDIPDPGWLARTNGTATDRLQSLAFGYQVRWRAAYADSCTGALAPRQRACLDAARTRVDAMFDALGDRAADGVAALAAAPAPERCITAPDATAAPVDPRRWRRAQALADLGRYREARDALPADASTDPAELAFLRGSVVRELGDLPAAEAALRRAVEQASRRDDAGLLADAQTDLAVVAGFLQDRHEAGDAYADAAVATAERSGDARRLAIAHCVQGLLAHVRGNPVAATELLANGIAELARSGAPPLDRATAELRLGWVLRESQHPAEARAHLERAAALRRTTLGADHPLTVAAEVEIAMTEAAAGQYAVAIAHDRAVIERLTHAFGPDHPGLVGALSALGTAQLQSGDYAGAEQTQQRVLALRRAQYGDRHVDVGRAYTSLANVHYYQGKYPEAIDGYRAAEATARSLLGGKHPEVATIRTGLALALQATNRLVEAAAAIADSVAIYRELPGHDRELADALMTQGTIELAAQRLVPARALLEESEAIQRRLLGPDHVDLSYVLAALGELYLAMDRLADAQRVLERSRELRTQHGAAPQLVAENDYVLAMVAWKQGRREAARARARSALGLLGDARPELREQIVAWLRVH